MEGNPLPTSSIYNMIKQEMSTQYIQKHIRDNIHIPGHQFSIVNDAIMFTTKKGEKMSLLTLMHTLKRSMLPKEALNNTQN